MESSRMSLALRTSSRTQFEVLGFEHCKSLKNSRTALIFGLLEMCQVYEQCCFVLEHARQLAKKIFRRTNFAENLQICGFLFWRSHAVCKKLAKSLSEDLFFFGEHFACPWFLALASDFFYVLGLGLEPLVLDSTSGLQLNQQYYGELLLDRSNECKHVLVNFRTAMLKLVFKKEMHFWLLIFFNSIFSIL